MTFFLSAWSWLAGSKLGRGVAIAGGAVLAVLLIYWRGRAAGRDGAELDRHRETQERVKEARNAADEKRKTLDAVPDDELDARLREHGL